MHKPHHMPLAPLVGCRQGNNADPWCRFGWRIEHVDGGLVRTVIDRAPKHDERLALRCSRCSRELYQATA